MDLNTKNAENENLPQKKEASRLKKIIKGILIGFAALLVVLFLGGVYLGYAEGAKLSKVDVSNIDELRIILDRKIANGNDLQALNLRIDTYLDETYDSYKNKTLSIEEAKSIISEYETLFPETKAKECLSFIDTNESNELTLSTARNFLNTGEYQKGLDALSGIFLKSNVAEKEEIEKALKEGINNDLFESAKALYGAGDYEGVMALWNKMSQTFKFSPDTTALIDKTKEQIILSKKAEEVKSREALDAETSLAKKEIDALLLKYTVKYDEVTGYVELVSKGLDPELVNINRSLNLETKLTVFSDQIVPYFVLGFEQDDWIFFDSIQFNIDGSRLVHETGWLDDAKQTQVLWGAIAEWIHVSALSDEAFGISVDSLQSDSFLKIAESSKTIMRFQGEGFRDHTVTDFEKQEIKRAYHLMELAGKYDLSGYVISKYKKII